MSEQAERTRSWFYGAVAGALLPLLYLLSVGPVQYYLAKRKGEVPAAIDVIYAPVDWLAENTPLREPLYWYLSLWYRAATGEDLT
jgi:hypothetical protein